MHSAHILIVEDEAIVASDLIRKLKRLGYTVCAIASTGEEAIAKAKQLKPQLVLMDIQLTGQIDGIEAAREIRDCCDSPVIFLTAHSDSATLARAKLTGPLGYILKPFDERDLATQIELAVNKYQADRKLREQREWLHVTLSSIGDAVIATDEQEKVTFINPVAESLTGWSSAEALGMVATSIFQLVDEQTREPVNPPIGHVVRRNLSVQKQIPERVNMLTKNGRIIPIEHRESPILDFSGKIIGLVITFQDVTDKRSAERALQHSEYLLNKAQEMAHLGSWELDVNDQGMMKWSDEVYRIFGLDFDISSPTYEDFIDRIHPDDRRMVEKTYSDSRYLDSVTYDIEHRIIRPDGDIRYVHQKCEHQRDKGGRVIRSVGMIHDITEQKAAQEALQRSNRELEQFAYVASHDLQEPLRAIIGFLQLLQSRYGESIDEKGHQFIERSIKAGYRMQSLIRELLSLSRVSSRASDFALADLNVIFQEVMESLNPLVEQEKATISCTELPTLAVDANQIRSLFQNLVINGIRYNSNPNPSIEIGCHELGGYYQFFIKDNGIGISPQFHQRIFVVFQRLHTEREFAGSGVGLAMCTKIVERHGGTIWVESGLGKGSTFYFTLPKSR